MISFVKYTDDVPASAGGVTKFCFIKIRPKYMGDVGIHKHEEKHVDQWWCGVGVGAVVALLIAFLPQLAEWSFMWPLGILFGVSIHPLASTYIWQYRLWVEVQAYREQAKYYQDDRRLLFAHFIHTSYNLSNRINERQIYERLKA